MTNNAFAELFGQPVRMPESEELTTFHMDIAASIQAVTELIVCRIAEAAAREYNIDKICLAGGVALNCVANGKLLHKHIFDDMWIQPAAGDAGGALGAAQAVWHQQLGQPRKIHKQDQMQGSYLGPQFTNDQIEDALRQKQAVFHKVTTEDMIDHTTNALADEKAVGWFQGRMEYGPRALGGRSILGDPRSNILRVIEDPSFVGLTARCAAIHVSG